MECPATRITLHSRWRKWRRCVPRDARGSERRTPYRGRYQLRECAWNFNANRRCDIETTAHEAFCLASARLPGTASKLDKIHDWTLAWRRGWTGSRYQRTGIARSDSATDDQSISRRPEVRFGLCAKCGAQSDSGLRAFPIRLDLAEPTRALDFQTVGREIRTVLAQVRKTPRENYCVH